MTTLFHKDVTCPCCGYAFQATVLGSTNTFGPQYTDFHVQAAGAQPLPLMMNTCEECGYSGFVDDFELEDIADNLRDNILDELQPIVQNEQVDKPRGYAFLARIQEWQGATWFQVGNTFMRAAWCCVDTGQRHNEESYRRSAIACFEYAIDQEQVPAAQLPAIAYLVGELYRRVGDLDDADRWFTYVIDAALDDPAWEKMAELATQQRDNPQEFMQQ